MQIQDDLSNLEYNILEFLFKNNSNVSTARSIENSLGVNHITSDISYSKLVDYDIIEIHKLPHRSGKLTIRVKLVDEKSAKYILN